jgi:hypothetical protein
MKKIAFALLIAALAPAGALADAHTPGNLLISTENVIYETTLDGTVVGAYATQYPGGNYPATEYARDLVVDDDGIVHLYNGTFSPYLSSRDPAAGLPTWTHQTYPDWKTVNNGTYGGIDVYKNQVFVTDMLASNGVVAFDMDSNVAVRFADGTDAIDLTVGLDGLLYVLSPGGSPGGRTVDVYDPETYALIRSIDLTAIFGWNAHRAIAVNTNGHIYVADWDGEIHHIDAAGTLIQTIAPPCDWIGRDIQCSFYDINISESGQLALGSRIGEIVITDVNFASVSKFQIGDRGAFVEFVPQPVGPTLVEIDVRPAKDPNKINLRRKKNLWVAILATEDFDPMTVDPSTVGIGANSAGINRSPRTSDVDGDGDIDLRLRFKVSDIGINCGDDELTLSGLTYDGTEIVGTDSIVTTGCD